MKRSMKRTGLLLFLLGLAQIAGGCIMEDKVVEIVVTESTCVEFYENHDAASFVNPVELDYAKEINEILSDNDISRDAIVSASLVSASYGVISFPAHDDWVITGSITVERKDSGEGAKTLWEYTSVSVAGALGKKIPAVLIREGVDVLNDALADFIAGEDPILIFRVDNSGVTPPPSVSDPIVFEWKGCIVVDIVAKTDAEIPDPF